MHQVSTMVDGNTCGLSSSQGFLPSSFWAAEATPRLPHEKLRNLQQQPRMKLRRRPRRARKSEVSTKTPLLARSNE